MSVHQVVNSGVAQPVVPSASRSEDTSAKIQKGATDFEALLLGQMLHSARAAAGTGLTGADSDDSESNSSLVELGEQQFAQALASNGGLGIAKMVIAGLKNAR